MLMNLINGKRDHILEFCLRTLGKNQQPRDDYKEFLELTLILKDNIIRKPGAYHQARWMAKGINCMKIFLLRYEFKTKKDEKEALCRKCGFIVINNRKLWFKANKAIEAPSQDISLLINLNKYLQKDESVARACTMKIINHLWYLADEPVVLSLFDHNVPIEEREQMAEKLRDIRKNKESDTNNESDGLKKLSVNYKDIKIFLQKNLPSSLITEKSLQIFERFNINPSFLNENAAEWHLNDHYNKGKNILDGINVVNDTAERRVKLMEEFNNSFT